ncbi:MAG: RNA polymerase sigma factor [Candidatus Pedobacter colombiensis]|uniref:RNA polymerase sigma factor n=1 Tax=Candidatus Pedobacter colombiensis TaxID=3121371 RepID=A0AAJ5WAH3_9SPHI|nr:RNA polymerase sigma factor [Pedobacter sp.]WEK19257.1 MAG: RNA polymerase sigma factor [Pedobacter sp.]
METTYIDKHIALVDQCRKGDRKAQFEIYKLYSKAMYNVAYRIVNFEEEAEDILQESFLDVFTRIDSFRGETTFGLWLKQIVINKSINQLRKRKVDFVNIDEMDIVEDEDDGLFGLELKAEEIRQAIMSLPDKHRVILSLYLLEGYDHSEIAHVLKISEGTSRSQFMRAKLKLNDFLIKGGVKDERY